MSKSPLQLVKEQFTDKAKLVEAVKGFTTEDLWVGHGNKGKGLEHVSNTKLLKLHAVFTAVKAQFGTRAKLISAIQELDGRTKDEGYKSKLSAYPVPRLFDQYTSTKKRLDDAKRKAEAAKAPKAPKVVVAKVEAPKAAKVAAKVVRPGTRPTKK
jgi:hypothetical protein